MSRKERDRPTIMIGIKQQALTLVAAAEVMAISYRQHDLVKPPRLIGQAGVSHHPQSICRLPKPL